MSDLIHPTAIIADGEIAADVKIGPYVIGGDVSIGAGSSLHSHVVIDGVTALVKPTRLSLCCAG